MTTPHVSYFVYKLNTAAEDHDEHTGEDNGDLREILELAVQHIADRSEHTRLPAFAEALADKFAGIDEYKWLHRYCYPRIKSDIASGDRYYTDGTNVYYFPKGWQDVNQEDVDHDVPEVWGYAPLGFEPDSEVDLMWVSMKDISEMNCITKANAQRMHPALFKHLEKIDNE